MTRFYRYTESGRWYIRNENGTFASFYYDTFNDLLAAVATGRDGEQEREPTEEDCG